MGRTVLIFAAGVAVTLLILFGGRIVDTMTTTSEQPAPAAAPPAGYELATKAVDTPTQPQFAPLPNGLQPFATAPDGQLICMGPLGPGTCAQITEFLARQGQIAGGPTMNPGMQTRGRGLDLQPMGAPNAGGAPIAAGPFPGAGMLPRDGQITMQIAEQCSGEPTCMAAAWMSVEVTRCRNGVMEAGGCFGPNGEIVKAINTITNDLTHGPGPNNDLVGENGWLRRTFGF